jgi:hypothetical protein
VNVKCIGKRPHKRKPKVITYEQASLRQVLNEDIMSSSTTSAEPLAMWKDDRVLILRKIGKLPLMENTWQNG